MTVIEYDLFRIKFVLPLQQGLFASRIPTTRRLFESAIASKASMPSPRGYIWHVGNIESFGEASGSFAIGRTTPTTVEKFDPDTGNFDEEPFEASPYTHCVFDVSLGLLAIARKPRLSGSTRGISNRLAELFSRAPLVQEHEVDVLIDPIYDPAPFLKKLMAAHVVTRYRATFTGPNPFDADALFQKPLSVYCQAANGTRGAVEVEGQALDKEVLGEVTRSTASTGNDASAKIQATPRSKPERIHLRGDQITMKYSDDDHHREQVAADMRSEYAIVRTQ